MLLRPAVVWLAFLGVVPVALAGNQEVTQITVLHTNDHHGRFWKSADGEYGLAARKTIVDAVRAEVEAAGGHVLLLDAGDVNTGVPESDLQRAEPDFRGMSAIGYDAMAVGNHEFDRGPAVMAKQRREWSAFPWLSANVYEKGARLFEPFKIFDLGRVKVAVLGLTTEDTARMGIASRFPDVSFRSPVSEAGRLVPQLRLHADIVIALTHLGHYVDGQHGSSAPGDVELARAVNGIDLIIGGHSHSIVCMQRENVRVESYAPAEACTPDRQNGTYIVQAGDRGRFIGRADFEVDADRHVRLVRYRLLSVNWQNDPASVPVAQDQRMLELLRPFQLRGEASLSLPVGRVDGRFDGGRAAVRRMPTNLGALITSAMRTRLHADVALVSSGGIRDSLPDGELTYRDLLQVEPFGNEIVVVTMTGRELRDYLLAAARMTPGSGGYAQVSGVRLSQPREGSKPPDASPSIKINGRDLDRHRSYRVALNSFIARGGDGYPDLSGHRGYVASGLVDATVLREFIATRSPLRAADFKPERGAWPGALPER